MDTIPHSRGAIASGLCIFFAPEAIRAWGMPGAHCTRSLMCKIDKAHELATTVTPGSPGIPAREWF
jgi:hypothetical protein